MSLPRGIFPAPDKKHRYLAVSITGPLSIPRLEAATRINAIPGAHYVERVTPLTDYLVSARDDTLKARNAKKYGTILLTEQEMMACLDAGKFPESGRRKSESNFPEITWESEPPPPSFCSFIYTDSEGRLSKRAVLFINRGVTQTGTAYWGGYDDGIFKTFREDRISDVEVLGE